MQDTNILVPAKLIFIHAAAVKIQLCTGVHAPASGVEQNTRNRQVHLKSKTCIYYVIISTCKAMCTACSMAPELMQTATLAVNISDHIKETATTCIA